MSEQNDRSNALTALVAQTTAFMKELTALVASCRLYVEKQTEKK